jgi:hypothetical protein
MSTITQKRKLSKGTWVLLFVILAAVITVAVLAVVGYISLAFLTDWLVGAMTFGASGWINAALVLAAPFALGLLFYYLVINYFVGQKVTGATGTTPGYSPVPTYPSAPAQSDKETKIS